MRKYIWGMIVLTVFGLGMARNVAVAAETANFQGSWTQKDEGSLSFDLDLRQEGNNLTGHHCGTTKNANRVDCSLEDEKATIVGTITGNTAKVKFTSAYSGQMGMAKITLDGDNLLWEVTAFPNGEYYLPDKAVMVKAQTPAKAVAPKSAPPKEKSQPGAQLDELAALVKQDLKSQGYQYEVEVEKAFVVYDDFNKDGIADVAAIFRPVDENTKGKEFEGGNTEEVWNEDRFLAIGFADQAGKVKLVLNKQTIPCFQCGGVYGAPEITLKAKNGVLSTSKYGGSASRWFEEQKIRYENDQFKVIGYTTGESYFATELKTDINFNTLAAVRSYVYQLPKANSDKTDEFKGAVRYKAFVAQKLAGKLTLDGKLDEPDWQNAVWFELQDQADVIYKPENWGGPADLSFTAATLWDDNNLYLAVQVKDDQVVPVENWENLLKGDHLELWFDFAGSLTSEESETPIRTKSDQNNVQIGVGVTANNRSLIRVFYPEKAKKETGINAVSALTPDGYQVEVQIPSAFLREFAPADFEWTNQAQFGFSVTVSDTDSPDKRTQKSLMSTSQLKWGNPYTLGACNLVEQYEKPDFPLDGWKTQY